MRRRRAKNVGGLVALNPNEGGRLLGEIMTTNGWSQVHVEDLVEASAGTVGRLLSGERKPGRELSERLRLRLGISPLLWDRPLTREQTRAAS